LAEKCNHVEIIYVMKIFMLQVGMDTPRDILGPHTPQPAATAKQAASVLPPFSGELRFDKELKLSCEDFKEPIKKFYGNNQLSSTDQLKATPLYPTPHVLALFAKMAYHDYKHEELKPPHGWQLLTTASHFGIDNGYFGMAYWHPEHQHVVTAHRGTKITNVGALLTDVKGVFLNKYVNQMSSASTFASKVADVLQEIEQEKKVNFELFFTGHSLGGWLAQITTFTAEYLEVKGGTFLKKQDGKEHEPLASSNVQPIHESQDGWLAKITAFIAKGFKD
jgi:hypothetical protein